MSLRQRGFILCGCCTETSEPFARLFEVFIESVMVREAAFRALRNSRASLRYSENFPLAGLLIG